MPKRKTSLSGRPEHLTGIISPKTGLNKKSQPKVLAIIPARFGSSRFPGKPLALVAGKTLLERLYETIARARLIDRVVVATDSDDIKKVVERFGGEAIMTGKKHLTGSDRTFEALQKLGGEIIINIQADNLGVKPSDFDKVLAAMMKDRKTEYASLAVKVDDEEILFNPHRVKVVTDKQGDALWFSRYPIPFLQGITGNRLSHFNFLYHVGVYFFRRAALTRFHSWKRTPVEKAESLEQMRILENGGRIRIFKIGGPIISIDTPQDLNSLEIDNL